MWLVCWQMSDDRGIACGNSRAGQVDSCWSVTRPSLMRVSSYRMLLLMVLPPVPSSALALVSPSDDASFLFWSFVPLPLWHSILSPHSPFHSCGERQGQQSAAKCCHSAMKCLTNPWGLHAFDRPTKKGKDPC